MPNHTRVLVVDAPGPDSTALLHLLAAGGHETLFAPDTDIALGQLERAGADVVLLAGALGSREAVARLAAASTGARVVVLADSAADAARDDNRLGAYDLVHRGGDVERLLHVVERALGAGQLQREVASLRARVGERAAQALIGRSGAITQVRELIGRAAASRITVLVTGEAGTGKDVVARLVHDLSDRAGEPFVTVRCAGVEPAALETELFGTPGDDRRGRRSGLLEETRGGTLVLDEFAALPQPLRARLAEAIAERGVGAPGERRPVDARLVLTMREYPGAAPAHGSGDALAGRLSLLPIALPPLRERRRDIPLLAQHFRLRVEAESGRAPAAISPETMAALISQEWPGNVRELEHYIERGAHDPMSHAARADSRGRVPERFDAGLTLEELEREYILHVLGQVKGHQSRAAELLGIDRRTLYRKLKEYREHGVRVA